VVTVLLSILNQTEFHLVQNRKVNCHDEYILFNVKGNGNIVFSVWIRVGTKYCYRGNDFGSRGELLMPDCLQVRASSKWNLRKHLNGIDPLCKRRQIYVYIYINLIAIFH